MKESIKNIAYSLLDLATLKRGVKRHINHKSIRFPARWSRYYEPDYEQENYTFLTSFVKPGMTVIDIGAHIGLFSAYTSQLVQSTGKVYCLEPTPNTFDVLKETIRLNKCDNVVPIQAAASASEGEAIFYISDTAVCNSNSLVKNKPEGEAAGYPVKLETIDGLVKKYSLKPDLIKIDAEGAELDVLKGGVNTFQSIKPVLVLGLHPAFIIQKGDSLTEIWDLLFSCGYVIKYDDKEMTKQDFCGRDLLFDVHCF